jgi:hypothetical protein
MLVMTRLGLLMLLGTVTACAADWPQWRGPRRDGISPDTGLLKSWPAGGPKLVWKTTGLGEGYSASAVVGGRLYTQGQRGDEQFILAYDTATGKKLWEAQAGRSFRERRGHGPPTEPWCVSKPLPDAGSGR